MFAGCSGPSRTRRPARITRSVVAAVAAGGRSGARRVRQRRRRHDRRTDDRDESAAPSLPDTDVVDDRTGRDRARRRPTRRRTDAPTTIAETTTTVPQAARGRARDGRDRGAGCADAGRRARLVVPRRRRSHSVCRRSRRPKGSPVPDCRPTSATPPADIELVGLTTEPNLEQIAALQPDLILGAKVRHEALYDQLSQIAPTVFSESSGTDWTSQVTLTGDALNRSTEADALLAEFDERAAAVGEAIGAAGKTAVIVRFIPGQNRLYGPTTFSGSVLSAGRLRPRRQGLRPERRHGADQPRADRHARHRRDLRHQSGRARAAVRS